MAREFQDFSNNNAEHIDFAIYSKHSRLVGLKASEGVTFVDKTHGPRCDDAHRHGVRVAHYAFAQPGKSAAAEADLFWKTVKPHFKRKDYCVLDLEIDGLTESWTRQFVHHFKAISGHEPVGYSGPYFLMDNLGSDCGIKRWWLAQYNETLLLPSFVKHPWAWQFTDGKSGPQPHSIPGGVPGDVSRLNHASWVWIHTP